MKLSKIVINNFRGIKDATIIFRDNVSFLVSNNNVGKTRILECIYAFYQASKEDMDVEFYYDLNDSDRTRIRESDSKLIIIDEKVRITYKNKKYMLNSSDAKSLVNDGIFGEVIYIPAVSDHSNETDVSKTTTSISKLISSFFTKRESLKYKLEKLNDDLKMIVSDIKKEAQYDMEQMNTDVLFSGIEMQIQDKEFDNLQIIKNNVKLKVNENGRSKDISELGTGVQRSIVNSIILHGMSTEKYTIILYDEPETFLNVSFQRKIMQKIYLNSALNTQYIIATHSPDIIYRCKNIFNKIIKISKKENNNIDVKQYGQTKYEKAVKTYNDSLNEATSDLILRENINETTLAWWDRNRVNALFEDKILIVEGPTEEIFVDLELENITYISMASGKFTIPYFKILFEEIFGIKVICMYDKDDESNQKHMKINEYIRSNIEKRIELNNSIEDELGYNIGNSSERRKQQILLEKLLNNEISEVKIQELKNKIKEAYDK